MFYVTWESFCFCFQEDVFHIVQTCCIWLIFHFIKICFFIYHLSIEWSYSKTKHLIFICFIKKGLVVETSLNLINILSYYFYLVHVIYYFYLTKINLSVCFHSISQVYDKQRKKHFSVVICVCFIMPCSEMFLSQDGISQNSMGCNKKFFLLPPRWRPLVNTIF